MPVHSLNRSLKPSLNHPKPLVYRCGSVCISVSARFRVYRDTRLSVRYCIVLRDQSHAIRGPGCRPFSRPHQDSSPTRTITHLLVFPRKNIENNKLQQITNHLSLVLKSLETNPSSSLYIYILDRKLSVSLELHQLIASNEHTHTHHATGAAWQPGCYLPSWPAGASAGGSGGTFASFAECISKRWRS